MMALAVPVIVRLKYGEEYGKNRRANNQMHEKTLATRPQHWRNQNTRRQICQVPPASPGSLVVMAVIIRTVVASACIFGQVASTACSFVERDPEVPGFVAGLRRDPDDDQKAVPFRQG
jgi:hypothetical protein